MRILRVFCHIKNRLSGKNKIDETKRKKEEVFEIEKIAFFKNIVIFWLKIFCDFLEKKLTYF